MKIITLAHLVALLSPFLESIGAASGGLVVSPDHCLLAQHPQRGMDGHSSRQGVLVCPRPSRQAPTIPAGATGPGPHPISTTAVHVSVVDSRDDSLTVNIRDAGPSFVSIPRMNTGDFALRLGPRWPFAQRDSLGVPGPHVLLDASIPDTQAWKPHPEHGMHLIPLPPCVLSFSRPPPERRG